jgi:hypothetical protein
MVKKRRIRSEDNHQSISAKDGGGGQYHQYQRRAGGVKAAER